MAYSVDTIVLDQLSIILLMRLCFFLWQKKPVRLSLFKRYFLCYFCEDPEYQDAQGKPRDFKNCSAKNLEIKTPKGDLQTLNTVWYIL